MAKDIKSQYIMVKTTLSDKNSPEDNYQHFLKRKNLAEADYYFHRLNVFCVLIYNSLFRNFEIMDFPSGWEYRQAGVLTADKIFL